MYVCMYVGKEDMRMMYVRMYVCMQVKEYTFNRVFGPESSQVCRYVCR